MRCTACTRDGVRCKNSVNLLLRNLPSEVQRNLHGALAERCVRSKACCAVCTVHAKEAVRVAYGPTLARKGLDVASMAFSTLLEVLSCAAFGLDAAACEELLTGSQGPSRWGF